MSTRPDLRLAEQDAYQYGNEQKDWKPLPPITFTALGKEGIRLTDAKNQIFSGLDGRDNPMFEDETTGISVSCRIQVREHHYVDLHRCSTLHLTSSQDTTDVVRK